MFKKIVFVLVFLLSLALLARLLAPNWYRFLAYDQPVEQAEVLLVEGWVSESTLINAAKAFKTGKYSKVIVASILYANEYGLNSRGTLVFNIHQPATYDSLIIKAHSEEVDGEFAKMMVMLNDDTLGETYTSAQIEKYAFPISHRSDSIKKIKIAFTNDYFNNEKHEDRNLILDSLFLDQTFVPTRTQKVFYDYGDYDGRKTEEAYSSRAGAAAEFLVKEGVPRKDIYLVDAPRVEYNKTYTTAKAVAAWMKEHNIQEKRMNLISENVHSRRSWMLFKKALPDDVKVGIIASSRFENDEDMWWKNRGRRAYVTSQTLKFWYAVLAYFFV